MKTPVVYEHVFFGCQKVSKVFRKVKRAKHIRIHVATADKVVVTGPYRVPFREFEKFFSKHKEWVSEKLEYFGKFPNLTLKLPVTEYQQKKEAARKLVCAKLSFWNKHYNFSWKRVTIRNQKTRWGSCSNKGTLSFHAAIIDLPEKLQDYLIVHELCHLHAMNHGKEFWTLLEKALPQGKKLDASLKKYSGKSIL